MANNFGVSFVPGGDQERQNDQLGGQQPSGAPPVQQAIRLLSLRLPRFAGPGAIAPGMLLNATGGGGNPMIEALLRLVQQRRLGPPSAGGAPVPSMGGDPRGGVMPGWPGPPPMSGPGTPGSGQPPIGGPAPSMGWAGPSGPPPPKVIPGITAGDDWPGSGGSGGGPITANVPVFPITGGKPPYNYTGDEQVGPIYPKPKPGAGGWTL